MPKVAELIISLAKLVIGRAVAEDWLEVSKSHVLVSRFVSYQRHALISRGIRLLVGEHYLVGRAERAYESLVSLITYPVEESMAEKKKQQARRINRQH